MLKGFEDQTHDMTERELKLVPQFVKGFSTKVGKQNSITNHQIITGLKKNGVTITAPRVRKVINYIRNKGLVPGLVATSEGYFVSNDPEEIQRYIESLAGRENEIRRIKEKFIEYKKSLQWQIDNTAPVK